MSPLRCKNWKTSKYREITVSIASYCRLQFELVNSSRFLSELFLPPPLQILIFSFRVRKTVGRKYQPCIYNAAEGGKCTDYAFQNCFNELDK